jgi:hypothetical protein
MVTNNDLQAGREFIVRSTGITFRIERSFVSNGEVICDSIIVAGPHSVGCRVQHRPGYGHGLSELVAA